MRYRLSHIAHLMEGQPMFNILAKVQGLERQGKDIIHFELGDPDFCTPKHIIDAACASLRQGEVHYTCSMGLHELREAVIQTTLRTRGFAPTFDQVLIAHGSNISIYYSLRCLVNPGDEVIVPDPCYPNYCSVIKLCGAVPVHVPLRAENEFRMQPADVRKRITDKTQLIIINSPQNPTGAVMTAQEISGMADIAEEYDLYLYSDEVYSRIIFDPGYRFSSPSTRDGCRKRTILANSFSKGFSMTGWRLGVIIGPEDVIEKMNLFLQSTSTCVSPFVQRAGIEAIRGDQAPIRTMVDEFLARRDLLVNGLNSIPGIRCTLPGGAFYLFPHIAGTGLTSEEFTDFLLEKAGIAVVPGPFFGPSCEGFVRFCYTTPRERIMEAIERIRDAMTALMAAGGDQTAVPEYGKRIAIS